MARTGHRYLKLKGHEIEELEINGEKWKSTIRKISQEEVEAGR
jgi:hypothetical protein